MLFCSHSIPSTCLIDYLIYQFTNFFSMSIVFAFWMTFAHLLIEYHTHRILFSSLSEHRQAFFFLWINYYKLVVCLPLLDVLYYIIAYFNFSLLWKKNQSRLNNKNSGQIGWREREKRWHSTKQHNNNAYSVFFLNEMLPNALHKWEQ